MIVGECLRGGEGECLSFEGVKNGGEEKFFFMRLQNQVFDGLGPSYTATPCILTIIGQIFILKPLLSVHFFSKLHLFNVGFLLIADNVFGYLQRNFSYPTLNQSGELQHLKYITRYRNMRKLFSFSRFLFSKTRSIWLDT